MPSRSPVGDQPMAPPPPKHDGQNFVQKAGSGIKSRLNEFVKVQYFMVVIVECLYED